MADRTAYAVLALGSASYLLFLFCWFSLPAFLTPVVAALGLSGTQAGALAGAVPLVYVPLGLASGLIIDRVGSARAIAVGLGVIGVAHAARSLAEGFPAMLALTLLLGVGGTGITFGLPKLVSDLFPPERSGTMSSVYLIGSYVGTAAAFGLGRPHLGPLLGGWRPTFLWSGAATVAFAVGWALLTERLAAGGDAALSGRDDRGGADSLARDLRAVIAHRGLRLLVVVGALYLFALHGLQGWLTRVLEVRGVPGGLAATATGLLIGARALGTVAIPPIGDRWASKRAMVVACGGLAAVGALGLLAPLSTRATVGLVLVAGVGIGGLAPLVRAMPIEMEGIGPERTAAATGLIFAVGEVGGFSGPFLIGALRDVTGSFAPGMGLLVAAGAAVAVTGALMGD